MCTKSPEQLSLETFKDSCGLIVSLDHNGLANRLRGIAALSALGRALQLEVRFYWTIDDECDGAFDNFVDIPFVDVNAGSFDENDWVGHVIINGATFPCSAASRQDILNLLPGSSRVEILRDYALFMSNMRPAYPVRLKVDELDEIHPLANAVGAHYRLGDAVPYRSQSGISEASLEEVVDSLKAQLTGVGECALFVCSDEKPAFDRLNRELDVWTMPYRSRRISWSPHEIKRSTPTHDAAVDLFALARCSRVIGTPGSSFSQVAAEIGGKPFGILWEPGVHPYAKPQKLLGDPKHVERPHRSFVLRTDLCGAKQLDHRDLPTLVDRVDPILLDVGANAGWDTIAMAENFPKGRVHAFEPDPRAWRRLREVTAGSVNVSIHNLALNDESGTVTFFESSGQLPGSALEFADGWDLSGSLSRPKKHLDLYPWCTFETQTEVQATTLDEWSSLHAPGVIDFIWMDVQGAEHRVFRGGAETLKRTRFLYTEYSEVELYEGQRTLLQLLVEFLPGWRVLTRFPEDVLLQNFSIIHGKGESK